MKYTVLSLLVLAFGIGSCKKHQLTNNADSAPDSPQKVLKVAEAPPFDYCNDVNPLGGGSGYTNMVLQSQATVVISTNISASAFKTQVESAPNQVIYILPSVVINLTGLNATINVPANTVIASNRGAGGTSLGALIKTDDFCWYNNQGCPAGLPSFTSAGNNIRFTGLRMQGPSQLVGSSDPISNIKDKEGILMKGHDHLEVDNCVMTGWTNAAIVIGRLGAGASNESNSSNRIHHNYFYNNRQAGLGYGVAVTNGYAVISKNIFEGNRHDIACSGYKNTDNTGYEAFCNTVLSGGTGHNFDVHGQGGDGATATNASTFFYIHHNLFLDKGANRTKSGNDFNILVRGKPDNQCRIEHNAFNHDGPQSAIAQTNGAGHLLVMNNVYYYNVIGTYLGWYVNNNWAKKPVSNFMNLSPSSNDALHATMGGDGIVDYAFGDANGDGKTDIYKIDGGMLYYMPYQITNGLTQTWTYLSNPQLTMNRLVFGHFNSDNVTDMIYQNSSGTIYVSYSCTSSWNLYGSSSYDMYTFKIADFTGDNIYDFFYATGGQWYLVNNSTPNSSWVSINTSSAANSSLKFGWFDAGYPNNSNNKADIFFANGTDFLTSYDATQSWVTLSNSGYGPGSLYIYDFNRDGTSDVINTNNPRQVGLGGRGGWANTTVNNFPINSFPWID